MNRFWRIVKPALWALVPVLLAAVVMMLLQCRENRKEKEIAMLKEQLAAAQTSAPLKRDTVRDTIEVVTAPVITAEMKALQRQHAIDQGMIRDLGLRIRQLEAVQTTVTVTKDSTKAQFDHNYKVFSSTDRWSSLRFRLQDSTFYYNIRDSLLIVVYHEYKHRFLWWRWGIKGYKVKAVNFNPHSTIIYNRYIKPEQ